MTIGDGARHDGSGRSATDFSKSLRSTDPRRPKVKLLAAIPWQSSVDGLLWDQVACACPPFDIAPSLTDSQ